MYDPTRILLEHEKLPFDEYFLSEKDLMPIEGYRVKENQRQRAIQIINQVIKYFL